MIYLPNTTHNAYGLWGGGRNELCFKTSTSFLSITSFDGLFAGNVFNLILYYAKFIESE